LLPLLSFRLGILDLIETVSRRREMMPCVTMRVHNERLGNRCKNFSTGTCISLEVECQKIFAPGQAEIVSKQKTIKSLRERMMMCPDPIGERDHHHSYHNNIYQGG
jgi:hypothetical protein